MTQKRKKLTPEGQQALEDELLSRLASGEEVPPGTAELFTQNPEFAERLAAKKAELRSQAQAMTKHCISSVGMTSLSVAAILQKAAPGVSQPALQAELPAVMARLKAGDNSLLEETLLGSILSLQTLSNTLLAEASLQPNLNAKQTLLHLGLRASNQLRQTVATLNEVKNPRRAVFVKKLNQLNQLNLENSKNSQKSANELLAESNNGSQELDSSAALGTGRSNQEMEALESEYRPQNC